MPLWPYKVHLPYHSSVLLSKDGLHLGDIRFAMIQMTLRMRTVSITVLERWIVSGSFNPESHG